MVAHLPASPARRRIVAAGLGALALTVPRARRAGARALLARGMTGGGLAQIDGGEAPGLANFAFFASAMQMPDGATIVLGLIRWVEAGSDLRLESLAVTQCVPLADAADGAEVRGRMMRDGAGDYPFLARAFDSGQPGSGADRLEFEVNTPSARDGAEPASGDPDFVYEVAAEIVAGDLQWIVVDADLPG